MFAQGECLPLCCSLEVLRISASPIATVILPDVSEDTVTAGSSEGLGERKDATGKGLRVSMCSGCDKVFPLII